MDVLDALRDRRSVREFTQAPVPAELLTRCLEDARWAPSWSNTQPYRVAVAEGAVRDELSATLTALFDEGMALRRAGLATRLYARARGRVPRGEWNVPLEYPEELQAARRATGFGLYGALGIAREDRAARDLQMRKNYEFFGAPVVVFLFAHEGLGSYAALDAGVFLQSFMLACTSHGLATCAQGALALWPAPIRRVFDVPPRYRLLVGCAVGYAAEHPVNAFNPGRVAASQLVVPAAPGRGSASPRAARVASG
jgi:nitroreductase